MTGYIAGFTFYTLAMMGVMFLAFLVAKKFMFTNRFVNDKFLTIESCLNIEPRKNLYVVKAGSERFLISTDTEGSRFLTKLENDNNPVNQENEFCTENPATGMITPTLNFAPYMNKPERIRKTSMMRGILEKLGEDSIH